MQARSIFVDTIIATAAISEYAPVTFGGALATAASIVKGVAQTSAVAGDAVAVTVLGTSQVFITENVAAGDLLVPDGTGKARKAVDAEVGFARANRNGVVGTRIEVMLLPR
ncbi:MAG: DUF2190 family protein [Burkholderiales bacterium]|jgi:regulator of RNase E activity RraA|nr:DUF2190 family protein [Burkholderiales bacterium]